MATKATQKAFNGFRQRHGPAWGPRILSHASEADQMSPEDGLEQFTDGSSGGAGAPDRLDPLSGDLQISPRRLWVVRQDDVVHAIEDCAFGAARPAGRVKHTNLTGGLPAFSGGELVFLDAGTLIVSGDSGRYGPRSAIEMEDVAIAFKESGYAVYTMGYDEEAGRAFPLVGPSPRLV